MLQVTLNIDASQFGVMAEDILKTITREQMEELTKNVMIKWLEEPYSFEREAYALTVLTKLRGDSYHRGDSDDKIREGYKYREELAKFKSSREVMVSTITSAIIDHYKNEVTRVVVNDPTILKMKEEVIAQIKEEFPKTVHDAMTMLLAKQMEGMLQNVATSLMRSKDNAFITEALISRLQNAPLG